MAVKTQLAMFGVAALLGGGCRDRHESMPAPSLAAPATPARAAAAQPSLAAVPTSTPASSIDNLAEAPPEARARLEQLVTAIELDRRPDVLVMVSSGGFVSGELSLSAEQVQIELDGRTVPELTQVPCGAGSALGACRWSVAARGAKGLELAAHVDGDVVAAIEMVREDDGSWAIARGHRIAARTP
jgi:hypothetical protein